MGLIIGLVCERKEAEKRVALDPTTVAKLHANGYSVLFESNVGARAFFFDAAYEASGAVCQSREYIIQTCDILVCVRRPDDCIDTLRNGQVLIAFLEPLSSLEQMHRIAKRGVCAFAFELLPRTVSRAQNMDALSSQANIAGYRAAVTAAHAYEDYFPMMITAAGTAKPAKVLVIGTGVAGLQAIATARRLGAVVSGYDIRPASKGEVESLGATFLTSHITSGAGEGGYARALTPQEQRAQAAELGEYVKKHAIIITTAQVPGKKPPLLVDEQTIAALYPGSVCVDLGASDLGGNIAGSMPDSRFVTDNGVTIIGGNNFASEMARAASFMYARNVAALLEHIVRDGVLTIDTTDEIQCEMVVCHDFSFVNPRLRQLAGNDIKQPVTEEK